MENKKLSAQGRERLKRRYRPASVRVLFVGEAPPASGRFFYQADSGLYRALRDTFANVFPGVGERDFLESFQSLGCYLVDLCGRPVDHLPLNQRLKASSDSEVRLAGVLKRFRPEIVITVVRSISANVRRSEQRANWSGIHIELPYPGRWHHHRAAFLKELSLVLHRIYQGPTKSIPL
jgi:hypothetical protein